MEMEAPGSYGQQQWGSPNQPNNGYGQPAYQGAPPPPGYGPPANNYNNNGPGYGQRGGVVDDDDGQQGGHGTGYPKAPGGYPAPLGM